MSDEDLRAELEKLRSENAALKKTSAKGISMKVSEKGEERAREVANEGATPPGGHIRPIWPVHDSFPVSAFPLRRQYALRRVALWLKQPNRHGRGTTRGPASSNASTAKNNASIANSCSRTVLAF